MDFSSKLDVPDYEFRLVFGRTRIDYDHDKEDYNRREHGYSLESAVHLFERLLLPVRGRPHVVSESFEKNGEVRHMHMSVADDGKVVFMVTTMREDETVRVISFRRASESERDQFTKFTAYVEG